jgi:hypothetical protein
MNLRRIQVEASIVGVPNRGLADPIPFQAAPALGGGCGVPHPRSGVLFFAPEAISDSRPLTRRKTQQAGEAPRGLLSDRLRKPPLALAGDRTQIGVEVDLDRVALGGDEALLQPAFVVGDLGAHLRN